MFYIGILQVVRSAGFFMKPGTYRISFSADGYVAQTQILKIAKGKTLDEEIRMVSGN